MNACKNAAGERLVNLRPLLRIFRDYLSVDGGGQAINLTIDAQAEDSRASPDYLSFLSYMYRFFRGGFRYKIISTGSRVTSKLVEDKTDTGKLTPSHITFPTINPVHEISVPYYSQYRKLPISTEEAGIMKLNVKTDATYADILRAGNDDLTFGWLMGTPQLCPGNTKVTWNRIIAVSNGTKYTPTASKEAWERLGKGDAGGPINPPVEKASSPPNYDELRASSLMLVIV